MGEILKRTIYIIIMALLIINITTNVFATNDTVSMSSIFSAADNFVAEGEKNQEGTINMDEMKASINIIYGVFIGIGALLATVVGMFLGIKLMMASSAEEKAQYKKNLVVYFVGCFVIFGAVGIWRLAINIIQSINS